VGNGRAEIEIQRDEGQDKRIRQLHSDIESLQTRLEQLANQLEFFQILLDSIPTPIYFVDLDQRISLCNMAFETVIQSIREDVLGSTIVEIVTDTELAHALAGPKITPDIGLDPLSCEHQVTFADGTSRHVEVRHVVYFNLEGEPAGTVGMIIDQTDQKRAEQAELEADRLRTAQKLAISVAHEFNNPLMIISGVYQLLKPVLQASLDDKLLEHVERVPRSVDRMHNLVQKLMKLTTLKEAEYAGGQIFFDLNAPADLKEETPPAPTRKVRSRKAD